MGLTPKVFKPANTPLYEYSRYNIQLVEGVELIMKVDSHLTKVIVFTNFLMVDTPSVYNIIIGRLNLNALRAIASTYHLAMKFPIATGVSVI